MIRLIFAAFSGGLFGAGLLLSGMTNPQKVRGWLDVFGAWDPTLAFVLGGALLPMAVAWRIGAGTGMSLLAQPLPARSQAPLDRRLGVGAILFGLGWGISGLCPGPALASLGFGGISVWVFFEAMILGMAIFGSWNNRASKSAKTGDGDTRHPNTNA